MRGSYNQLSENISGSIRQLFDFFKANRNLAALNSSNETVALRSQFLLNDLKAHRDSNAYIAMGRCFGASAF